MQDIFLVTFLSFFVHFATGRNCRDFSTSHSYKGGQSGYLRLPFAQRAKNWDLEVILDRNVTNLDIFEARLVSRKDSVEDVFMFTNEYWNGRQDKGANLSLGYQANFAGGLKPSFSMIVLNNQVLCSNQRQFGQQFEQPVPRYVTSLYMHMPLASHQL